MAIKVVFFCLVAMLVMGFRPPPRGILYTNSTEPYTKHFRDTPVGEKSVSINSNLLQLRISGEWDEDKLMRVAREEGITKLHYIDIKTLSILGIYRRTTFVLYGD